MKDYQFTLADADDALAHISPDLLRDEWATIAMALKAEFGADGFDAFDNWSQGGDSYKPADARATWQSVKAGGGITIATLIQQAKAGGWQPTKTEPSPEEKIQLMQAQAQRREKVAAQQAKADATQAAKVANCVERSAKIWEGLPEGGASDYLSAKQVRAWGVRFSRGAMVVPVRDADRKLVGLQFIQGDGAKRFLTGTQKRGSWHLLGDITPRAPIAVAEGYATAASIHQAMGWTVAVAFDAGNILPVVKALHAQHPEALFMICADDDYKTTGNPGVTQATKAAQHCGGRVVVPGFDIAAESSGDDVVANIQRGTDWNDLHVRAGLDEVRKQLLAATQRPCETPAPPVIDDAALTLDIMLERYALAMPDAKVWDFAKKQLINKKAARTSFAGLWDEWIKHPRRKNVDQLDLVADIAAGHIAARASLGDALRRYVYLSGTTDVWDRLRGERGTIAALKIMLADDYEGWLKNPKRRQIHHSDLIFDPASAMRDGAYINTYKGLPLTAVRNDDACSAIRDLTWSLCNQNKQDWQWLISWLALPLQRPGTKMATAVLMHSPKQGSGKSLLFDTIMRALHGCHSVTVTQHELEDIYTVWQSEKTYAVFEEVMPRGHKYDFMGLVKQMVTGKTFRVREKFVSSWEESNFMNCVFLSNEVMPLYLEEADRRFFVVWPRWKMSEELRDRVLHELANGGAEAFYAWLLSVDVGGFTTHTEPPMNEAKEQLIEFGRMGWELFAREWRSGALGAPFVPARVDDLYTVYKRWCEANGERSLTKGKFTGNIRSRDWVRYRTDLHYSDGHGSSKARFIHPRTVTPPEGKPQGDWLGDCVVQWDEYLNTHKNKLGGQNGR